MHLDSMSFECNFCKKSFLRESSLLVHVCEQKKRFQERNERGVQLGLQAYQRFYEITQGSARFKTYEQFAESAYYRAFVKFGRYCVSIRAIGIPQFIDWLINNNKKLDQWCCDALYTEYLHWYLGKEAVEDAMSRAIEESISWSERNNNYPAHDLLRYGNCNQLCHMISNGRISAWVLYNCDSGIAFLNGLNQEQLAIVWPWVNTDFWQKKFVDYPADQAYAREILKQAGW